MSEIPSYQSLVLAEIRREAQRRLDAEMEAVLEHKKKAYQSNCMCPWCSTIRQYVDIKRKYESLLKNEDMTELLIAPWRHSLYAATQKKEMLETKHWKMRGNELVSLPDNFLAKYPNLCLTLPETIAQKKERQRIKNFTLR